MSIKRVVESIKPRGITYHYTCGHTHFMPQAEVREFVYGSGEDVPTTCQTCAAENKEA